MSELPNDLVKQLATLTAEVKHGRHDVNNMRMEFNERLRRIEGKDHVQERDLDPLRDDIKGLKANQNKVAWAIIMAWLAGVPVAAVTLLKNAPLIK
jgi:ribosome recycling factor